MFSPNFEFAFFKSAFVAYLDKSNSSFTFAPKDTGSRN